MINCSRQTNQTPFKKLYANLIEIHQKHLGCSITVPIISNSALSYIFFKNHGVKELGACSAGDDRQQGEKLRWCTDFITDIHFYFL